MKNRIPYFIGVDIGTTATKALALADDGRQLALATVKYPVIHPQADWSEQDPVRILKAVIKAVNTVQAQCKDVGNIQGLCFSAAMHSLQAVDVQGDPLGNTIIWADNRAATIAEGLRITHPEFYLRTGTPLHAMSPLPKLCWLREHAPELFEQAGLFCGIKEFVLFHLCQEWLCDHSIASATGLMNLQNLCWDAGILAEIGLNESKLPALATPQTNLQFRPTAKGKGLQIPSDCPIIIGASDGCLANLGAEDTRPGDLCVTIGTSAAIRRFVPAVETDTQMRTFCYLLDQNRPVIGGGASAGAHVVEWLRVKMLKTGASTAKLLAEAAEIAPGSDNLLVLPYLIGERAPIWNAHARGTIHGLTTAHTRAHLIRATMESIIYHLATIAEVLEWGSPVCRILAGGGFSHNATWVQILADVFGKPVWLSDVTESSARGAVMLGREALRLSNLPALQKWQVFEPNPEHHTIYQNRLQAFKQLYRSLNP